MLLNQEPTVSIRIGKPHHDIQILDQRHLPHQVVWETLTTAAEVTTAIGEMHLRGAPLIGAAGAYGYFFCLKESFAMPNPSEALKELESKLRHSRPTAVNLNWAIDRVKAKAAEGTSNDEKLALAWREAELIVEEDIAACEAIGEHGLRIIKDIHKVKNDTVHILMHCNPGWLACLDWGTATAPIYKASLAGIPVHVWVDETRPRNQGAKLTAFEFQQQGVPYTVITDNAGGHLMQHNMVDLVLVGSDRTTINGDVANKIGTYLKALAARDNDVPFYVALPSSTFDPKISDGLKEIPIEERNPEEVLYVDGLYQDQLVDVLVPPKNSRANNFGFDVTPARLVTGLITERGLCQANREDITRLFPEFLEQSRSQ